MREEFETWYMEVWGKTEDCKPKYIFDKSWNGEYMRMGVRLAWSAFSAAWEISKNDTN